MSLQILVPLVVVGVSLVVLAVYWLGLSRPARLGGEGQALERYGFDFPGANFDQVLITADRQAALLIGKAEVGLVEALGSKFITRRLAANTVIKVERNSDLEVAVGFADFTHGRAHYRFADLATADAAQAALNVVKEQVAA